jgi:hypothetical protein
MKNQLKMDRAGSAEQVHGGAVHVECSLTHSLKATWFQTLTLEYQSLVSKCVFQIQLAPL